MKRSTPRQWTERYHQQLFDWHDRQIFPFTQFLQPVELDYLQLCFRLLSHDNRRRSPVLSRSAHLRYTHHIRGAERYSGHLAYGVADFSREGWVLARKVAEARAFDIAPLLKTSSLTPPARSFYAISWDFHTHKLSFYFREQTTPPTLWQWTQGKDTPTQYDTSSLPHGQALHTIQASDLDMSLGFQPYQPAHATQWFDQFSEQVQWLVNAYRRKGETLRYASIRAIHDCSFYFF